MAKKRNVYKGGAKARDIDLFYDMPIKQRQIGPQLVRAFAISDEVIRKEYSQLRSIANKRLKRMAGKPEAIGTYGKLPSEFPKVKGMTRADLVRELGKVSKFLTAERGSISGIRLSNKKIAETLKDRGINVPKDQIAKFGAFMNAMKKALNINRGDYASKQTAKLWEELFSKGKISQAEFERKVKALMKEIEEEEKQTFTRAQRREVNKLLRDNPIDTYFDELALNPATVKAINKKNTRKTLQTSQRARRRRKR